MKKNYLEDNLSPIAIAVHSLKGNAGNFGAYKLYILSEKLEKKYKNNKFDNFLEELKDLTIELDFVFKAIEKIETIKLKENKPIENNILDEEQLKTTIEKLMNLIEEFDSESTEVITLLINGVNNNDLKQKFNEIKEALELFDFDTAQDLAEKVKGDIYGK